MMLPPGHAAALQRCEAATPGPWTTVDYIWGAVYPSIAYDVESIWDQRFIAAARTDLPTALAHLQRMAEAAQAAVEAQRYLFDRSDRTNCPPDARAWFALQDALAAWRRWGEPEEATP